MAEETVYKVSDNNCCYTCGKKLTAKTSVSCYSKRFSYYNRLDICSECLDVFIKNILEIFKEDNQQALLSFCQAFDIIVSKEEFITSKIKMSREFLLSVISKTALPRMRGKSFFDGAYLTLYNATEKVSKKAKKLVEKIPEEKHELAAEMSEIIEEFGYVDKFGNADYKNMKAYYDNMLLSNPKATEIQKQVIRECAKLSATATKKFEQMISDDLDIMRTATLTNKQIEDTISKKLSDAMLRTKDTKEDESAEIKSVGAVFSILERMGKSNDILKYKNEYHYNEPRDMPDSILENIIRVQHGNDRALGIEWKKFAQERKYPKDTPVYDITEEEISDLGIDS